MQNEDAEKIKFIIVTDGFWESVVSDTYMFATLFSVLALNHLVLNDSTFGAWLMAGILFIAIVNRGMGRQKRMTIEELKKFVDERVKM